MPPIAVTSFVLDDAAKTLILATLLAVVLLLMLGLPIFEKIRATIGAAAQPLIESHNSAANAHVREFSDLGAAVEVLHGVVASLQRQIDVETSHRKEQLEAIERQLSMAIKMLQE